MKPPVTCSVDVDGLGWIVFDDPESRANIFNPATLAALRDALEGFASQPMHALVLMSRKERIFVAGADLNWLASLPDAAVATQFARDGQQLFQSLAKLHVPVICAIHGACAGGGFELALACHWRVASDAPVTQIGLPETSIGTIPGWGGCVRLPRLIGVKPALEHVLNGQLLPAADALKAGLIDELVAATELEARARALALEFVKSGVPLRPTPPRVEPTFFADTRAKLSSPLPAPRAAISAIEQSHALPLEEALEVEARHFGEVTAGDICKNLIRVFFLKEAAKKRTLAGWFPEMTGAVAQPSTVPIRRVGVVGAGVMGSGIAQWLAARGYDVVLRDVHLELIERGLGVIRALFDEAVRRGKTTAADAAKNFGLIRTTTGWDGFADCELVIEAIVENVAAKQELFSELAAVVRADALLASNTSALPIEEIAGHVPNPGRILGIHFFNPVSRMPLVELILGRETSPLAAERALALVKALGKSPVICRSSPGFLVTRVLFFYLNEAVKQWERGMSTTEIDSALRAFGWPMGPLRLVDEVGVDVTNFIFGEMAHYFPRRFERSTACTKLLAAGLNGRKNGASAGFYRYDGGGEAANSAADALRLSTDDRGVARVGSANPADIAEHLLQVMIAEAQRCLEEGVVKSADEIDFALLTGAGFPAWRGGLMRYAASKQRQ